MCHDGLDTIIALNLKAQEVAEPWEDADDVKLARQATILRTVEFGFGNRNR